jgi:hypothetical protein
MTILFWGIAFFVLWQKLILGKRNGKKNAEKRLTDDF